MRKAGNPGGLGEATVDEVRWAVRLRRSKLNAPGLGRRRSGRGFRYLDRDGRVITDPETLARIRALVIPPAWTDVWICPDPRGHIQATGFDVAGRKQYRYHDAWRTSRDAAKFDRVLEVAGRLPEMRDRLCADLAGRGLSRERVLAAVVRLLDLGTFRIGGDSYAARDEDPAFGLSTLRPDHVHSRGGCVTLEFTGKSGVEHSGCVEDGEVAAVLTELKRRRRGEERLFAYWDRSARRWREIHADEINDYLREIADSRMTAKDFRTWRGTVTAALALAAAGPQRTPTARKKAVASAVKEVAEQLGNTPAVARTAYVDPRVIDAFENGEVAGKPTEAGVRKLLRDEIKG